MDKEYLSPKDLQKLLQMGTTKLYKLLNNGAIPGVIRIGGSIRIRRESLEKYLRSLENGE